MFKYIERLREKSEATRQRYAFGISLALILILAGGWFGTAAYRNHNSDDASVDTTPSPVSALFQNIKDGVASTKANIMNANPFAPTPPAVSADEGTTSSAAPEAADSVIISDTPTP